MSDTFLELNKHYVNGNLSTNPKTDNEKFFKLLVDSGIVTNSVDESMEKSRNFITLMNKDENSDEEHQLAMHGVEIAKNNIRVCETVEPPDEIENFTIIFNLNACYRESFGKWKAIENIKEKHIQRLSLDYGDFARCLSKLQGRIKEYDNFRLLRG